MYFEVDPSMPLTMNSLTKLVFRDICIETASHFFTTVSLPVLEELLFTPVLRKNSSNKSATNFLNQFESVAPLFYHTTALTLVWDAEYDLGQLQATGDGVRMVITEQSEGEDMQLFSGVLQAFPNVVKLGLSFNEQPWAFYDHQLLLHEPPDIPLPFINLGVTSMIHTLEIFDFFPHSMFLSLIKFASLPSLRRILFNNVSRLCAHVLPPTTPQLHSQLHAFINWKMVENLFTQPSQAELTFLYHGAPNMLILQPETLPDTFILPKSLSITLLAAGITLKTLPLEN
jgi:hypothetical protein